LTSRTQNDPFGRGDESHPGSRVADHIGGSARVLPDLVHHSASPSIDVVGVAWPGPGGRGGL